MLIMNKHKYRYVNTCRLFVKNKSLFIDELLVENINMVYLMQYILIITSLIYHQHI